MAYVEKNWLHRLLQFFLGAALGGAAGVAVWKDGRISRNIRCGSSQRVGRWCWACWQR